MNPRVRLGHMGLFAALAAATQGDLEAKDILDGLRLPRFIGVPPQGKSKVPCYYSCKELRNTRSRYKPKDGKNRSKSWMSERDRRASAISSMNSKGLPYRKETKSLLDASGKIVKVSKVLAFGQKWENLK